MAGPYYLETGARRFTQESFFRHADGPMIHVSPTPQETHASMADDLLDILASAQVDDTVLLATGNTFVPFFAKLIARARERGISLAKFRWGHIDNFSYNPREYPSGTDDEDYEKYLRKHLIEPAGIPEDHFFPIKGLSANPAKTAADYDRWLGNQHIIVVLMGLGPEPVVHIAYMRPDMDLEQGAAAIEFSPETDERNKQRAQKEGKPPPPKHGITLGLPHLRRAEHKFVLAYGDSYAERVRLTFGEEINPNVIATHLRTEGFRDTVNVYLDRTAAKYLTD